MSVIAVERKPLVKALTALKTLTTKRNRSIPILQGVKLTVNGALRLETTDLEIGARVTLDRRAGAGKFERVLPMDALLNAIRAGKASNVSIGDREGGIVLDSGAKMNEIAVASDYPASPPTPKAPLLSLPADVLAAAVRETVFAVSTEVVRYALTGVLIERKGRRVSFVTSDGKRLSRRDVKLDAKAAGKDFRLIFPVKPLALVGKLAQGDEAVTIRPEEAEHITRAHLVIGDGRREVYSRLVEGHFPDYEAIRPGGELKEWTLPVAELLAGLEAVMPYTTDKTRAVRFTFDAESCTLFTRTQDVGEGNAKVPAKGPGLQTIIFNPEYLMDYLKALPKGTEDVRVKLKDKAGAGVWSAHEGHEYILMPLTISL